MTILRPASQFESGTQYSGLGECDLPENLVACTAQLEVCEGEADGGAPMYTPEGYMFNVARIVAAG